ncbi:MAG: hypothetical protein ACRDMJ_19260 [Solirubrobacteraceae bacterium]
MTPVTSSTAPLPVTGLGPIDPALEPANVRNGNTAAKNAYQTGLAFENILASELVQQMTATVPGLDGSDASGSSGSSDGSSGSSSDSSGSTGVLGAYAPLMSQALTSGLMADGGTGVAMQIARSIDPALDNPAPKGASK